MGCQGCNQNVCFAHFFVLDKALKMKWRLKNLYQEALFCTPRALGMSHNSCCCCQPTSSWEVTREREMWIYQGTDNSRNLGKPPNSERRDWGLGPYIHCWTFPGPVSTTIWRTDAGFCSLFSFSVKGWNVIKSCYLAVIHRKQARERHVMPRTILRWETGWEILAVRFPLQLEESRDSTFQIMSRCRPLEGSIAPKKWEVIRLRYRIQLEASWVDMDHCGPSLKCPSNCSRAIYSIASWGKNQSLLHLRSHNSVSKCHFVSAQLGVCFRSHETFSLTAAPS